MGSKRKLAPEILHLITSRHNGITDLYDLFGGGGSISFTAVKDYRFNVHYNELNSHIFHLVKYLKENRTLESKFYEWVTREVFFEQIRKSNEDADWYSGFVMSCWSFGNNQSCYIYGENIEEIKRLAHEFVVNGCIESMKLLDVDIRELLNIKDLQKRRIVFCDYIQKGMGRFDLQNQERLQQLERIQKLQKLQNLQNLQNLQITNFSYENVNIKGKNLVIYCDIPYKGTGEYKEGGFNHEAFYKWAADINYPVYISEYDAPFQEIHSFTHRSSLSATNNKKKTVEKIFWNEKGNPNQTKLFT
jgi:site-specific DNA-adenine methylase